MGQAKQRGPFETRLNQAINRSGQQAPINKAAREAAEDAADDRRYARRHQGANLLAALFAGMPIPLTRD